MHSINEIPTSIKHTDCTIEIAQMQPIIMVTKAVNRPQSPRQFFEKLYGHLETPSAASNVCDDKKMDRQYSPLFSSRHSEISSSPDISDSRTRASPAPSMEDMHHMEYKQLSTSNGQPQHYPFMSPQFSQFRPMIGLPHEHPFPVGLSAFLARRRRKEGRPRRQRTTFSSDQTFKLEVEFHRNEYISRGRRFELAENLCLSETQIKIWFQNRRAKDKRIEKAQIDHQYRNFAMANGFMQYPHMRPAMSFLSTVTPDVVDPSAAHLIDSARIEMETNENSLKLLQYDHHQRKTKTEHHENHYFKENTTTAC